MFHVWEKKKWCIFCRLSTVQNQLFWKFHSAGMYVITLHHSNIQVTILVTCLNFAGTWSRILLHSLSLRHRVISSQKFTLNLNGEVSYRELARRPREHQCQTILVHQYSSIVSYQTILSCSRPYKYPGIEHYWCNIRVDILLNMGPSRIGDINYTFPDCLSILLPIE